MLHWLLETDASGAQTFLRLALGLVMFPHGAQKVLGWFGGQGFERTLQAFSAMGFPPWSTILLMVVEFAGPVFLVLGLFTRVWAFGIGTAITVCMLKNHVHHGFFMNWFGYQQGEGFEYHILVIGIVLALVARGGGMLSIDKTLSRKKERKHVYL